MSERIFRIEAKDAPKYEHDLNYLEEVNFRDQPGLCDTDESTTTDESLPISNNPDVSYLLYEADDPELLGKRKMISGECTFIPVDSLNRSYVNDIEDYSRFGKNKALYVYSTSLLPEFRHKGRGTRLKRDVISEAQLHGFRYLCGHGREGETMDINLRFKAQILNKYGPGEWYNSDHPHYFYEIDLNGLRIVKPYLQTESGCGSTSLKMLLDYHKLEVPTDDEIAKICGTSLEKGTPPEALLDGANVLGLEAKLVKEADIENINEELRNGNPVIVSWFSEDTPHWSVADELDEKNNALYLKDPEFGGTRRFTPEEFKRVWFSYSADEEINPRNLRVGYMITAYPKR